MKQQKHEGDLASTLSGSPTEQYNAPWRCTHNSWDVSSIYDADGRLVSEVCIDTNVDEDTQEAYEQEKDARALLIAAAPDLLEVVRALVWCCNNRQAINPIDENSPLMDAARDALARATGADSSAGHSDSTTPK